MLLLPATRPGVLVLIAWGVTALLATAASADREACARVWHAGERCGAAPDCCPVKTLCRGTCQELRLRHSRRLLARRAARVATLPPIISKFFPTTSPTSLPSLAPTATPSTAPGPGLGGGPPPAGDNDNDNDNDNDSGNTGPPQSPAPATPPETKAGATGSASSLGGSVAGGAAVGLLAVALWRRRDGRPPDAGGRAARKGSAAVSPAGAARRHGLASASIASIALRLGGGGKLRDSASTADSLAASGLKRFSDEARLRTPSV